MSRKTLAICIPTHQGRAQTLKEAIDSILPQIIGRCGDTVQICVSDNGTSDETADILAAYKLSHPNIFVISRFDENRGGRVNLLKSVSISDATYCWLFGSDDMMNPGAVDTMLAALARHPETTGVTCSWLSYSFDMQWEVDCWSERIRPDKPEEYVYSSLDDAARDLGIHFGYFSGQVFRRDFWDEVVASEGLTIFEYGHFILVYMIQRMIQNHPTWVWIGLPLVRHRDQNTEVLGYHENKIAEFYVSITADMFKAWEGGVGTTSSAYRRLSEHWYQFWYYPKRTVLQWKLQPAHDSESDAQLLACMFARHKHDRRFLTQALLELLVPHTLVKMASKARIALGLGTRLRKLAAGLKRDPQPVMDEESRQKLEHTKRQVERVYHGGKDQP